MDDSDEDTAMTRVAVNDGTDNQFSNPFHIAGDDTPAQTGRAAAEKAADRVVAAVTARELDAKEKEVEIRERALKERESNLLLREKAIAGTTPTPNWPPLCPVYYHSLEDIPINNRKLVTICFAYVHVVSFATIFNAVVTLVTFTSLLCAIFSLLFIPFFTWLAWQCQYKSLLRAARQEAISDTRIFWFMFHLAIGQAINVTMAVGALCGAGFIEFLKASENPQQTFLAISTTVWFITVAFGVHVLRRAVKIWKSAGGTIDKAKAEVSSAAVAETVKASTTDKNSWAAKASSKSASCAVM